MHGGYRDQHDHDNDQRTKDDAPHGAKSRQMGAAFVVK